MIIYKYTFVSRASSLLKYHSSFILHKKWREGAQVKFGVFPFYWIYSFPFRTWPVSLPAYSRHLKHSYWMKVGYYEWNDEIDHYRMSVCFLFFAFWRTWKVIILLSRRGGAPVYSNPLVGDIMWQEDLLITWNSMQTPTCIGHWLLGPGIAIVVPHSEDGETQQPILS